MPGASPSSANHRQPTMMEVQVEGTTLREEDYDPADWTKIIGTYQGKSQSKARMEDTNGVRGKQKASEERTETLPASTWRPTYRPNPAHLRATQQVKRKSREMAPLPQHAIKVVFRSQGGLFLPNIQPQRLLRCLFETAKIPMGEEVQLRVHPMNNTCTVATTNQEAALNLVKIRSITLNAKAYGVAAYIVPAADTVRGVISNAFWDETEEELLQDLQARNPEAGILLARRMGKSKSILITFAQGPIPRRIIYYGGVHLCTPYRARPEACTNCRAPGHRYDVCPEPKIPRCPRCGEDHGEDRTRQCVPRCILCGGEHLTGTGWCKATKRQQTTKPPVNRETIGRRQLHPEDFPRWNPSAPPKAPEELTWAERIVRRPDPRYEEMQRDPSSRGGKKLATGHHPTPPITRHPNHHPTFTPTHWSPFTPRHPEFISRRNLNLHPTYKKEKKRPRIDSLIDERFKILENKLDTFCTQLRTQMGLMVVEATNQMQTVPLPIPLIPPPLPKLLGSKMADASQGVDCYFGHPYTKLLQARQFCGWSAHLGSLGQSRKRAFLHAVTIYSH
ncbi:hypothetical protein HPB49_019257 [Dermacentor silvarum]|uniref:Uncharacterized protein n=1 Tax=Dermacentor silvarum TaxID=543639 RepID=A0ACB8DQB9_DERSI|nr:hypothetical protein HPB49_019257 [Dermacentor silvarum]